MANPKVFEFAKEVGMETLALMAKIREWQLPIKSHMAELTPDLVEQIRGRLNPHAAEDGDKKLTVKKKVKPRKAKVEASEESSGSAPKVVRRKALSEAEMSKKSIDQDSDEFDDSSSSDSLAHVEAEEAPIEKPSVKKTKVVKKAVPEESVDAEASEGIIPKVATSTVAKKASPITKGIAESADDSVSAKVESVDQEVKVAVASQNIQESSTPVSGAVKASVVAKTTEPATQDTALSTKRTNIVGKIAVPVPTAPTPRFPKIDPAMASARTQGVVEEGERRAPGFIPARKKEVVVGQSGFSSSQRPANEVQRKNIVGRMDLSRVTPPPSSGPRTGGFQGGSRGGYQGTGGGFRSSGPGGTAGAPMRSAGRNNLRAGFVAQPLPIPEIASEESSRRSKFEEKHKRFTKPATEVGPTAVAEEEEVAFNSSEFRKREMVFQPKKKKGMLNREGLRTQITTPKASKRLLKVNNSMKLVDVAEAIGVKAAQVTKVLMQNGVTGSMNTDLDFDTIALILPEFGWEAQNIFKTADEVLEDTAFGELDAKPVDRPPVVTVMGHVDHGKTSLLDAIRQANVAAGEKGGITQHIGAYQVKLESGDVVTFLDTPGHEAFTAMRARGANATDIAVIVVAADDGVMPQTAEAINHAKAAGVPIVIALNKMDKPGANPDRIKQQLTEYEIVPEEWGGTNIFCEVSAIKKQGIKELLEQLLLVAEMQELKANPNRSGTGIVIESRLEKGRGSTATILVQDGTVAVGDLIVAGVASGRVRSLMNDRGERVTSAGPGAPVEVLGLDEVPGAGDKFDIVVDEKTLERVVEMRKALKVKADQPSSKMSLEEIFAKVKQGDQKVLNVILKSDVMGSSEAIQGMFQKLATEEVRIKVIHSAVGGITEGDVLLAATSKAIILGFNTRPDSNAASMAKTRGVEIRTYGIVYEMMDELKRLMAGLLEPEIVEQVHGRAEVRNLFSVPKIGVIAGCSVLDGKIARSHLVRLVRNGVVVYQGKIGSLKRFKDDAKEVAAGFECGIGIENFNDIKMGDIIEAYSREEVRRELTQSASL